jgi:hypothetical protein
MAAWTGGYIGDGIEAGKFLETLLDVMGEHAVYIG